MEVWQEPSINFESLIPIVQAGMENNLQYWDGKTDQEKDDEWFLLRLQMFFYSSSALTVAESIVVSLITGLGALFGFLLDYLFSGNLAALPTSYVFTIVFAIIAVCFAIYLTVFVPL